MKYLTYLTSSYILSGNKRIAPIKKHTAPKNVPILTKKTIKI